MQPDSADIYRQAPPNRGASSFVYPPTKANIAFFANALRQGCVVAIPTETVYGLAGLALDETACRSIFSIKGRPLMDPLIVHVANLEMADSLAELPEFVGKLAEAFWPGPLTLILKKKQIVPGIVTAGLDTVAIRMPRHPVAHALLEELGAPLAAPSANPFGYVSPSRPEHVSDSFGDQVPFILDGGPCEIGLESTILDLTQPGSPRILRPGAVSAEALSDVLGLPVRVLETTAAPDEAALAPGTLHRHYSPRTRLSLFEGKAPKATKSEACVFLQRPTQEAGPNIFWFSEDGDANTIARSLFSLLRTLDQAGFNHIHCESPSPSATGVSVAIRDRLRRAANRA